jgi:hypothetical protein
MTADLALPKSSPADIASRVIEGIASGTEDILADERSRAVFAELREDDRSFDANIQKMWDSRPRRSSPRSTSTRTKSMVSRPAWLRTIH